MKGRPAGLIPCGPITSASSRLQVYLPQQWLAQCEPDQWIVLRRPSQHLRTLKKPEARRIFFRVLRSGIRTVIFQKVNQGSAPQLMAALRLFRRKVIYVESDQCENLAFAEHVDQFVAPSESLAADLAARCGKPVALIPDPLEYCDPDSLNRPWVSKASYRTLWIGNAQNWHQLVSLKGMLIEHRIDAFDLVTISDHPDADLPWSLETVHAEIERADLGIIPLSGDRHSVMKSHNRATLFMALGVPLIVRSGDVYRGLVKDGETGFVYADGAELSTLPARLADAALVQSVRERAMAAVAAYGLDRIAPMWGQLVDQVALSASPTRR